MKPLDEFVNEASRSEKYKQIKTAEKAVLGNLKNVKTMLIMSCQNPLGIKASNRENRNADHDFSKFLKDGHFAHFKVLGKYGQYEDSYFIYNVTLDQAKAWNMKYMQDSFIFVENDGNLVFSVYKYREEPEPHYEKTGSYVGPINNAKDAEDFFTKIGKKFQFNIPFDPDVFEQLMTNAGKVDALVESKIQKDPKFVEYLNESMNDKFTGRAQYVRRMMLYSGL